MAHVKVLLVDDEEEFVRALQKRLTARGLQVETALRGDDAVKMVKAGAFDVVVLDLAMPGMDGVETLKHIRAVDDEVQVILLTGHATVQKGVDAMKEGAADFLQKPAEFADLLAKIEEVAAKKFALAAKRRERELGDILGHKGW